MVDFGNYNKHPGSFDLVVASRLHSQHSRPLEFSVFGQFCVPESLEILDAKIAFPASSASLPLKVKKVLKSLAPHWRRRIA